MSESAEQIMTASHARAFSIAQTTDAEAQQQLRASINAALQVGDGIDEFHARLRQMPAATPIPAEQTKNPD